MPSPEKKQRNKNIYKLRKSNPEKWTFEALGQEFNISRVTAYQIYKREKEAEGMQA